jgi:hypothetical protein
MIWSESDPDLERDAAPAQAPAPTAPTPTMIFNMVRN